MRKNVSCVLALCLLLTMGLGLGCHVTSVSGTMSRTRTTGPNGTTTTTTVGGTIVIAPHLTSLSSGDFYVVIDSADAWQISNPKLEITKPTSNGSSTEIFDLEPDETASVSNIDKTTTPYVYKLTDTSSFSSFISTLEDSVDQELSYSLSFETTQIGCDVSGDYLNHLRFGSGSELVYLGAFTYRVTPSLIATCDDDVEIVNVSIGGKDSINEFLSNLY